MGRPALIGVAYALWITLIVYGLWLIYTGAWTTPPAY